MVLKTFLHRSNIYTEQFAWGNRLPLTTLSQSLFHSPTQMHADILVWLLSFAYSVTVMGLFPHTLSAYRLLSLPVRYMPNIIYPKKCSLWLLNAFCHFIVYSYVLLHVLTTSQHNRLILLVPSFISQNPLHKTKRTGVNLVWRRVGALHHASSALNFPLVVDCQNGDCIENGSVTLSECCQVGY